MPGNFSHPSPSNWAENYRVEVAYERTLLCACGVNCPDRGIGVLNLSRRRVDHHPRPALSRSRGISPSRRWRCVPPRQRRDRRPGGRHHRRSGVPQPQQPAARGDVHVPAAAGAHIDKFSMDINGKMTEAELLPADKARSIYEEIVRKTATRRCWSTSAATRSRSASSRSSRNGTSRSRSRYTQLLKSERAVEYTYPLNTEKFSARPLKDVSVKVKVKCDQPLKSIYCPSHEVEVKRHGEQGRRSATRQKDVRPDTDFKLIFTQQRRSGRHRPADLPPSAGRRVFPAAGVAGHRHGEDARRRAKDICFVLDTSGSMAGHEDGAGEEGACVLPGEPERGRPVRDRPLLHRGRDLFSELEPADKENIDKRAGVRERAQADRRHRDRRGARPSAEMPPDRRQASSRPLRRHLPDRRPADRSARPTRTRSSRACTSHRAADTRIFSFGIGTDVNTHLLDRIADDTRAFSQYVLPEEDIEVKVSNFYTKIRSRCCRTCSSSSATQDQ